MNRFGGPRDFISRSIGLEGMEVPDGVSRMRLGPGRGIADCRNRVSKRPEPQTVFDRWRLFATDTEPASSLFSAKEIVPSDRPRRTSAGANLVTRLPPGPHRLLAALARENWGVRRFGSLLADEEGPISPTASSVTLNPNLHCGGQPQDRLLHNGLPWHVLAPHRSYRNSEPVPDTGRRIVLSPLRSREALATAVRTKTGTAPDAHSGEPALPVWSGNSRSVADS
jgi:hypothetical protein